MKFFKKTAEKIKSVFGRIENKANAAILRGKDVLAGNSGEGYVDTGVKILIAVVIGALLLAGLYALFNTTIMPTVSTKIKSLFNYSGT